MPRKQKINIGESDSGYSIRFIPVLENEFDARERRARIQSCLVQMFLRASTPGKSKNHGEPFDVAA